MVVDDAIHIYILNAVGRESFICIFMNVELLGLLEELGVQEIKEKWVWL